MVLNKGTAELVLKWHFSFCLCSGWYWKRNKNAENYVGRFQGKEC